MNYILKKISFLESVIKIIQISMLPVFVVVLGCGTETMPPQVETPKIDDIESIDSQSVEMMISVTQETRQLYQRYCAQCHGIKGKGDGINALYLVVPPRDHTKSDYLETRTDQQLFNAIKLGGLAVGRAPCMPAWEHTFEDKIIYTLVNYIRELCNCKTL
jgi:cytochrome c oxidase cbb3-type subunit 3